MQATQTARPTARLLDRDRRPAVVAAVRTDLATLSEYLDAAHDVVDAERGSWADALAETVRPPAAESERATCLRCHTGNSMHDHRGCDREPTPACPSCDTPRVPANGCEGWVNACDCDDEYPTNVGERADLAPLLTASLELLAAIESIDVREGDDWTENALCPCGERLAACAETFNGTCGLECVSLQLLWLHSPTQDQSPATVARTVAAIERSFAKGQR